MTKIFVSYARDDAKIVKRILRELNEFGFDFWMDTRNLQSGDSWPEEITDAILDSSKFLLFMSAASMASDNIKRETQIAYENKKRIIILRLDETKIPKSLNYQLAAIQWTDYSSTTWKTRIAMALRGRSKPSSSRESAMKPPPVKPQIIRTRGAQKITSELENIFSASGNLITQSLASL